ncbi:MAG: C_GCAxxG_C_C family protein [Theionarchaea archaeon]|nr:C_GCAxxG_C_C family protein [Theionarchaea archaeon]
MDVLTYSEKGFNCAESVLLALSDHLDISCECIPRIATGFGGGMMTGNVCGAVSGSIMAFGLKYGRLYGKDKERAEKVDRLIDQFVSQFEKIHGSILCKELTGVDLRTAQGREEYVKKNIRKKCLDYVVTAVQISESVLHSE